MKSRWDSQVYTNALLAVIAITLIVIAIERAHVPVALQSSAWAQESDPWRDSGRSGFGSSSRGAPVDTTNVATVQDPAVARATSEVAAANREIASAIRDLVRAVQELGSQLSKASAAAAKVSKESGGTSVEVSQ